MHRRDYVLIAKVLRKARNSPDEQCNSCVDTIISNFCSALKEEANSFNEQKFRDYIEKGKLTEKDLPKGYGIPQD